MSIRAARHKAKKTVAEVVRHMGVSDAAVYQWETGETTPRPDKLVKLAEFFGVSIDFLLTPDDTTTADH